MSDQQAYSLKTRAAVDPDSLLTEDDKAPKAATAADCTTRRRACKNCVCGRAEEEQKVLAAGGTLEDDVDAAGGPPAGGCGNCSRGDAFRCAGCPYNGKPAWNAGDDGKVQLSLTDDV
jgi:anamorsin